MEIRRAMLVLFIAMSIPVILAATVFPTAMIDTRELLAWGREFPIGTFKHPPLMFWFGGVVDALFGPHAFWSVLWSQVLNAIGVYYCWLILQRVTNVNIATLMAVYLGTSLTYAIYSLAYALNADMIQIAFWAAILFHLIRAVETNSWPHWLALGLAVGLAILAKYTALLFLAALAFAVLFDAKTRTILTRPGAWAALVVAGLLVLPHGLWVLAHPEAFDHAAGKIISSASLLGLAESYVILVGGTLALLAPGVVIVGIGLMRREYIWRRPPAKPNEDVWVHKLATITLINCGLILAVLIPATGLIYFIRYSSPFLFLVVIAAAPMIGYAEEIERKVSFRVANLLIAIWCATGVGAAVIYSTLAVHNYMQEPSVAIANHLRDEWRQAYSCDPAYIIGDRRSAHSIALEFSKRARGIAMADIAQVEWYNSDAVRRHGVILVAETGSREAANFGSFEPNLKRSSTSHLPLDYRRNFTGKKHNYSYVFVLPSACIKS